MGLHFFTNTIESGMQQTPNELFRGLEQAFVNDAWDNTTSLYTIKEQEEIGSKIFNDIEAWLDTTVADTTTGLKTSGDFLKIIFKDINHRVNRGQLYQFDNNYWIVHNYGEYSGVVQQCGVRRCNNRLKIIDPLNGKIETIPCCVDYDMASPSAQTSRYIITPNNHAIVMVQGNDMTLRLLKTNTRYILSGRPFKLYAYQNAIEESELNQKTTLLYLELYLDELHDKDDIENSIADNGEYNYSISIESNDIVAHTDDIGNLSAYVMLNGEEVVRNVEWTSSNSEILSIDNTGNYRVLGNTGENVIVTVNIEGNSNIKNSIQINIKDEEEDNIILTLNPVFNKIRQFESIYINPLVIYNGVTYDTFDNIEINIIDNINGCVVLNGNKLTALNISDIPIIIEISIENSDPVFSISQSFPVEVVSMMG